MARAFPPSSRRCGRRQPDRLIRREALTGKQVQHTGFDVPGSRPFNAKCAECLEEPFLEQLVREAFGTLSDVRTQRCRRLRRQPIVEVVPHVQNDPLALGSS